MSGPSQASFGARARAAFDARPPPHSPEAEANLLGALVYEPLAFERVRAIVSAEDFYETRHQLLWGVIAKSHADGVVPDHVILADLVGRNGTAERIGGEAYLAELAARCPVNDLYVESHARIVKEHSVRRKVLAAGQALAEAAHTPGVDIGAFAAEETTYLREVLAEASPQRDAGEEMPSAADLLARNLEPREWLAEGLVQRAKTIIVFGPSYAGKSVLSVQFGLSLARGDGSFLGFRLPGRAVATGYFMGENDEYELADTLRAQCDGGQPPSTFRYLDVFARPDRKPLGTPEGLAWYRAAILRNGIELAIIDNLMSLVGEDLKDTEAAVRTMEGLKRVSKETCVSWLVLAHTRKEGSKGDEGSLMDKLYGAHEWGSYADSAVHIAHPKDADRDDPRREIHVAKVRGARPKPGFIIEMDRKTLTARYVAEMGRRTAQNPLEPEEALDFLREHGPIVTIDELKTGLGISRATAYRLVGSAQWRAWIADGSIEVTAKSQRGSPTAFRIAN